MERSLVWTACIIGCIGWLCGLLAARSSGKSSNSSSDSSSRERLPRASLVTAIALPILVFCVTLPSKAPLFAPGHAFGNGFLMGAIASLLGALVLFHAAPGDNEGISLRTMLIVGAQYSIAVAVAAAPLLRGQMSDQPQILYPSIAIGWLCVAFVLSTGRRAAKAAADTFSPGNSPAIDVAQLSGVCFTALVCCGAALGELSGSVYMNQKSEASWSAVLLAFAAGIPLALVAAVVVGPLLARLALAMRILGPIARLTERLAPGEESRVVALRFSQTVLAAAAIAAVALSLSYHMVDGDDISRLSHHVWHLALLGIGGGLLIWWSVAARLAQPRDAADSGSGFQRRALPALVMIAGAMASFQILGGVGLIIMLLGSWAVFAVAIASGVEGRSPFAAETATELTQIAAFGSVLMLFRLFSSRYASDLRGVSLDDHYALFGIVVGACIPGALMGYLGRADSRACFGDRLGRLVAAALVTLAVPTIVLALWGTKCAPALLIGTALSVAMAPARRSEGDGATEAGTGIAMFAMALGLALAQWTYLALPLNELTRFQKEHLVVEMLAVAFVVTIVADYGGRFAAWRKRQTAGSSVTPARGAA